MFNLPSDETNPPGQWLATRTLEHRPEPPWRPRPIPAASAPRALRLTPPPLACEPPFWARGCHLQTLAAQFLGSPLSDLPWQKHRLELASGDALALQTLDGTSGVLVHLFHGMSGSTDEHYMRRTAARLHARGHAVLAVNHRGAGAGKGWSRGFYHAGSTGDMAAALAFGKARFPHHLHVAIAFSMSASILLLLMGRDARKGVPDLAIAVNPPVDLEAGSRRLQVGLNQAYDRYFISCLREEVQARVGSAPLQAANTTRALDQVFTAAMAGFPTRDAYYAQCSCGPHLRAIRVPTVIISSMDDPLAPAADLSQQVLSPAVQLHIERFGGHMGYITGNLLDRSWLNYAMEHYLDQLIAESCHPWF